jgi:hypothetical protein
MFSRFTSIASQTNTTVTAITNPTVGDIIAVKNNFSTNLSSCFTNRNNAVAAGATITSGGDTTYTQAWQRSLTTTHTITFASANAARYFFNAGGRITWAGSRSGGSATSKNTAWSNLLTACGTLNITTGTSTQAIACTSYTGTTKTGGSGTPTTLLTTIGFYDLTTSDQEIFKQFDSNIIFVKPHEYLPVIGFQILENIDNNKCKRIGDPNGFCGVWCIWWIYHKMKNCNRLENLLFQVIL